MGSMRQLASMIRHVHETEAGAGGDTAQAELPPVAEERRPSWRPTMRPAIKSLEEALPEEQ